MNAQQQDNAKTRFQPYSLKMNSINSDGKNANNTTKANVTSKPMKSVGTTNNRSSSKNDQPISSILKKSKLAAPFAQVKKVEKVFPLRQNQAVIAKSDTISNLVFPPNNYDLRDYQESNQMMRRKFATNKQQEQQQQALAAAAAKKTNEHVHILTLTIEKIKAYQDSSQKNQIMLLTIAQLDSVITDYPNNGRHFYIKEASNNYENMLNSRMQCIFYEMDRKLQNLVRGSFLRLVGYYNQKKKAFICYSVRSAAEYDLAMFGTYIDYSDQSINAYNL